MRVIRIHKPSSRVIGNPRNIRETMAYNINNFSIKKIKESQPTRRLTSQKDKLTIILEKDITRRI